MLDTVIVEIQTLCVIGEIKNTVFVFFTSVLFSFCSLTSLGGIGPGPSQQATPEGFLGDRQIAERRTRGAVAG